MDGLVCNFSEEEVCYMLDTASVLGTFSFEPYRINNIGKRS
jgi:hypothetical protein